MNDRRSLLKGLLTLPWTAKALAGGGFVPSKLKPFTINARLKFLDAVDYAQGEYLSSYAGFSPRLEISEVFPAYFEEDASYTALPANPCSRFDSYSIDLLPSTEIISQTTT